MRLGQPSAPTICRPSACRPHVLPSSPEVIRMPGPARAKEAPVEMLPLEERIRRRAYELYVLQGNQSGSELDDWLQAEDEIRQTAEDNLFAKSTRLRDVQDF